ncbi:hypothetical protein [Lentzea guizhouensis]|uniref:hypothetical protein n=1 Tax=Lentzea guizhouensis TaxID=1586287 RepID=UPI001472A22B|nr:hypothetical protein [Lentzea guizhouensis]
MAVDSSAVAGPVLAHQANPGGFRLVMGLGAVAALAAVAVAAAIPSRQPVTSPVP